ncbi:hypothetical protein Emag_001473 [Eimeria magna]
MRRLLQGVTSGASPGGGKPKREAVLFSEEGWARAASTPGYRHPTAAPAAGEEETDEELQHEYPEAAYAEAEVEGEGETDYSHYYEDAAEAEKQNEAEVVDEEAYDPAYHIDGEAAYEGYAQDEHAEIAEDEEAADGLYAEEEVEADPDWYVTAGEAEGEEEEQVEEEAGEEEEEGEVEAEADDQTASLPLVPYSLAQIAKRVRVRHVEGKGRCLYTRSSLAPGEVIFVEKPVLVAVPSLNPELWDLLTTLNEEAAFDLPPIWHLAALSSLTSLGEEGFKICMDKWVPETDREPSEDVLRVCSYIEGEIDPHMYERMLLVWRYNSFGHHSEAQGLVLYNRISMMAHSCKATACWHYGEDDAFVLRARVALQEGDEITISYIGDDELFKSTNVRREKVQGWLFTCQCVRCSDPVDSARGFRCATCGTGSMFFKTDDEVTTSSPCTLCGTVPSEDTINEYVTFETAYAERLAETSKNDMPDAETVYEQATRVFTRHWILFQRQDACIPKSPAMAGQAPLNALFLLHLPLQLDTILFEGYRAAGDYEAAYVHQTHRLNYVTEVLPLASYSLAWLYEEMGDVLWSRIQAKGKPYADSRLRMAGRHFEDAYNLLYILCGPDHEYTSAAASKRNKVDELTTAI